MISYYEDVYDAYNNPDSGLDANVKGKLYPHYMSMPISLGEETVWIPGICTGDGIYSEWKWITICEIES